MRAFNDIFVDCTCDGTKVPKEKYLENGKNIIVDQGQNIIAGYTNLEDGLYTDVPAIIFGDHTRIIKYVDIPFFLGADGVKLLKSKDSNANYKYLYYALKNARIPDTGYNRHFKWLKEVNIEYPDSNVQEKVVKILDKISKIIGTRKKILEKLDNLIKARFVEMFGDIVLNPNGWDKYKFGDVCDVRDGTHDSPQYYREGYPLVTSKNVTGGIIDITDCSLICEEDYRKINQRSKVDYGDILMPMIGTVGSPIIVNVEPRFAIKNVALIKFKDNSKVLNTFVKALLESDYFDNAVINKIRGGTQKFISLGDIRKLEICLPPIEVQEGFESFTRQVDKSKVVVQQALDKAQLLFDSLMQKYFG
jgi:type I restriction enzyme S subunit